MQGRGLIRTGDSTLAADTLGSASGWVINQVSQYLRQVGVVMRYRQLQAAAGQRATVAAVRCSLLIRQPDDRYFVHPDGRAWDHRDVPSLS